MISKTVLFLLVLVWICLAEEPSKVATTPVQSDPVPVTSVTQTEPKKQQKESKSQQKNSSGIYIFINSGNNENLQKFDITKLSQTQQQVDKFIRKNSKVGTSNLIDARGDDDTFVYTYQNKSDDSEQVWVITVAAVENDGKDTTKQKYAIVGSNYVSNRGFTKEEQKKFNQEMQNFDDELDKQMSELEKSLNFDFSDYLFDRMWHKKTQ